jgi:ATP adenylyltransferase
MQNLFSPWRLRYITSAGRRPPAGCVFCRVVRARRDRDNLILFRGRDHFVILNRYPYNNGHLMIVASTHLPSLQAAEPAALVEMTELIVRCDRALRKVYRPSGINLGMNLGRSAGAGIAGHYHMHLVPRWDADTNFMTVIHDTRVIPESLLSSWRRLRPLLASGPPPEPPAAPRMRKAARRRRGRGGGRR